MAETKHEKKEPIIIDNTINVLNWLEKGLKLIKEYGIGRIITGALLIAILSVMFWFIFNPTRVFEVYDEWKKRQHDTFMELRIENGPKIQRVLEKLTYKVDASRCVLLELHNGVNNNNGLPFAKCSATYEALNIGVRPIASYYQSQSLTLMPFMLFLFEKGFWNGNVDELMGIDKALAYKMKSNNTEHFTACVIEGIDKPLAILVVSFDAVPNEQHCCKTNREYIRHVAMELSVYLEIETRISEKHKSKNLLSKKL